MVILAISSSLMYRLSPRMVDSFIQFYESCSNYSYPLFTEMFSDSTRDDLVATCASDSRPNVKPLMTSDLPLVKQEEFDIPGITNDLRSTSKLTLVTQVSLDRLNILEKTLQRWENPISLTVYVTVKSLSEGLPQWQRYAREVPSCFD